MSDTRSAFGLVPQLNISKDVYSLLFGKLSLSSMAALAKTSKAERARYNRILFSNPLRLLSVICQGISIAQMTMFLTMYEDKILDICHPLLKDRTRIVDAEDVPDFLAASVLYSLLTPLLTNRFGQDLDKLEVFLAKKIKDSAGLIASIRFLHIIYDHGLFCAQACHRFNHKLNDLHHMMFYKNMRGFDLSQAHLSHPVHGVCDLRYTDFRSARFFITDIDAANINACQFDFNRSTIDLMLFNYFKSNTVIDVNYFHAFKSSTYKFTKTYIMTVLNLFAEGFLDVYQTNSKSWVGKEIEWEVWHGSAERDNLNLSSYNNLRHELFSILQPAILKKLFALTDSLVRSLRFSEADKILLAASEHRAFTTNLSPTWDYLKKARAIMMSRLFEAPPQPVTPLEKIAAKRMQYQTARTNQYSVSVINA